MEWLAGLVALGTIGALVAAIVYMIASQKARDVNGIAMLSAFHDMLPKDKQEAVTAIIEERSSIRRTETFRGENRKKAGTE